MDLANKKCVPCEVGTAPMSKDEAKKMLVMQINGWKIVNDPVSSTKLRIRKRFDFKSYMDGVDFVNKVAKLAEEQGHHPDIYLGWRRVTINLMTHNIGGLSQNDFVMAAKIDKITASPS